MFWVVGPGSQTDPTGQPIRLADVTDGLSNTLLFGERSHFDRNHDSFAANLTPPGGQFLNAMGRTGWWCAIRRAARRRRRFAQQHVPINFKIPSPFSAGGSMVPPATTYSAYLYYNDRRISAFGSNHPGGANFALADGSVRFLTQTLSLVNLQRLSVRNDGNPVSTE